MYEFNFKGSETLKVGNIMKVICVGEMLIDFVCTDRNAGLVGGQNYVKKSGGAPANVAACIGKLGGEAVFVGSVGKDPFGDYLKKELEHYHVNTNYLSQISEPTTLAFVSLFDDGEREFDFIRGADKELNLSTSVIKDLLNNSILHLGSATALLDGTLKATYLNLAIQAKINGNLISFDPNYRIDLWKEDTSKFCERAKAFFSYADLVKVSEDELVLLTQKNSLADGCEEIHKYGVRVVFVTLGSKGCLVSTSNGRYLVPAYEINAIDTTGAGDSFIGAVLFKLSKAESNKHLFADDLHEYVEFAEKVSAHVCSKLGAMSSLPSQLDIDSMNFEKKIVKSSNVF